METSTTSPWRSPWRFAIRIEIEAEGQPTREAWMLAKTIDGYCQAGQILIDGDDDSRRLFPDEFAYPLPYSDEGLVAIREAILG